MARDFHGGRVDIAGARKIPKALGDKLRIGFARAGDVLLTHKGTVGLVAMVPEVQDYVMLTPQVTYYRTNPAALLNTYLKYAFQSPFFRHQLESYSAQSTRPYIGITAQKDLELEMPPPRLQRRIADTLSAYDELIENNQRRIEILEEMARRIYREWFVYFRFPGHENHPRVPSPLGEIPKGWGVRTLGEIAEDVRRNVPKGPLELPRPYVGLEHIPRRSLALDAWEMTAELGSNKLEFKKGEVLFGKIRPYFHKVSVAPFDGLCSADTIVIRARQPEHYAVVAACVSSDEFVAEASATANGAKMPRANWGVLEKYQVVVACGEVAEEFSSTMTGLIEQQQALVQQVQVLRRTRDLLLPRLLSGHIKLDAA
ncbi:MAG: restriction endonuclease subunit S [Candidatus Eisenbacteria bacterium]|nr:restriction endonuclease subunit S [Candidatus Eisenbacteria bacterium]